MCKYTIFNFLCGGQKLKIVEACDEARTNYQGLLYCPKDPHAHVSDGNSSREYLPETYGPGICINANCRIAHGMVPVGKLDFTSRDLAEDDREFDMSPEACAEREDRWYRQCLATNQQLDAISTKMPPSIDAMSSYAKWWLYIEHMPVDWVATWAELSLVDNPDEMSWSELNPRYLSQRALHHVTGHYLPANVTDTRHSRKKVHASTTPRMPALGPFKTRSHTCRPNVGYCTTCGDYHGKEYAKKPHKYHEANFSQLLQALANDRPTDLSGLRFDMPHVRPTLDMPTPFHGNNFNRKIGLVNTGVLSEEENMAMIDDILTKQFGPVYQSDRPSASVPAAFDDEMTDDLREDTAGAVDAFDGQSSNEAPDATFDGITPASIAKHALSNGASTTDDLDGTVFDFGDFGDDNNAMMLDI